MNGGFLISSRIQIRNSGSDSCRRSLEKSPGRGAGVIFANAEAQESIGHFATRSHSSPLALCGFVIIGHTQQLPTKNTTVQSRREKAVILSSIYILLLFYILYNIDVRSDHRVKKRSREEH
jgi:hypothetical protein